MSLDVTLTQNMPTEVFSANITHNLGLMAEQVKLGKRYGEELNLYKLLWRPDELVIPILHARELGDYLDTAWNILLADPDHFKKFNPENGWGEYENLQTLVYKYRNACWDYPESTISVSR